MYEGRNVSHGYASFLADLNDDDKNSGILHTGDMAEMDEDGYFYLV